MREEHDLYNHLLAWLDEQGVSYRLIDHAPEGRTELVSPLRGNALSQAAKCIVLLVKIGKKVTRYVLAVVPGDARVDLAAVRALMGATYLAFASPEIAERLAGSVTGTILPFSFSPELELVVDPSVLDNDELYFNAARLDRSMVLKASDYVAVARPRLAPIVIGRGERSSVAADGRAVTRLGVTGSPPVAVAGGSGRRTMPRDGLNCPELAPPVGPFSHAVRAGEMVYVSGQVAQDPATGHLIGGGATAQAERVFENLRAVLGATGRDLSHVIKVTVYLTDMNDFAAMNAVYEQHFEAPYPARTTIAVKELPLGARVEIDCIA
jgi:Ala-tRNA(Pro) deacylase